MSWTEVSKINRDMRKSLDALINEKSTSITNKLDALDILINNRSFPLLNNGTQVGTKRIKGATVKHIKNYKLDSADKLSAFTQKTPNCPYAILSYVEVDGVIYALCGNMTTLSSGYRNVYIYIYKCDLSATTPVWSVVDTRNFTVNESSISEVIKSNLVYIKEQKKLLYIYKYSSYSSYYGTTTYAYFVVYDLNTNTSTLVNIGSTNTSSAYLFFKLIFNLSTYSTLKLFYKNNKLWAIPQYTAYSGATGTGAFYANATKDVDLLPTNPLPILWSIDLNVLENNGTDAYLTQLASNRSIQNCLYAYRGGISNTFKDYIFSNNDINRLSITPIVEDDYMLFICSSSYSNYGSVVKIDLNEKEILDFSSINTSNNTINHKLAPAYAVREINTMNMSSSYPRNLLGLAFIYNKIVYFVEQTNASVYNLYTIDENTLARTLVISNETIFTYLFKPEALTDRCNGLMYLSGSSIYTGGINKEQVLNKINDVDEFEFIFE